MKRYFSSFLVSTLMVVFLSNCVSSNVTPPDPIGWDRKDLKSVAEHMSKSIKSSGLGRRLPRKIRWMLAQELANDTAQHINTRVIIEKIRTQLIRKRLARFIDDQAMDDILREQSLSQSALFDNRTAVKVGKLVGARLILRGRISSIRKQSGRTNIIFYNVTLTIVDLQTREIIWTDEAEITRSYTKSSTRP